jgi:hypothetical protein
MAHSESEQSPPHEYFVDLAKRSPKMPIDKMTPFEKEHGHLQFGNNFYLLFLTKKRVERGTAYEHDILIEVYLKRAEALGESWQQFLAKNRRLLQGIDLAIDGTEPYSELLHHYRDLLLDERITHDCSLADEFGPLIEPVGIYAWRRLNSLLERAAGAMKKVGIDAKEFFG